MPTLDVLQNSLDVFNALRAVYDGRSNIYGTTLGIFNLESETFQIFSRMESCYLSGWISFSIPKLNVNAIGIVDKYIPARLNFNIVGILFCLLLADAGIFRCLLGLDYS